MDEYYVREVRNTSENRGDDFGFWIPLGSSFSENGSMRGVLVDGTAAIHGSSNNRYLLDNMSCARAIDDTAANNVDRHNCTGNTSLGNAASTIVISHNFGQCILYAKILFRFI